MDIHEQRAGMTNFLNSKAICSPGIKISLPTERKKERKKEIVPVLPKMHLRAFKFLFASREGSCILDHHKGNKSSDYSPSHESHCTYQSMSHADTISITTLSDHNCI